MEVFIYFLLVTCFWCWLIYRKFIFMLLTILFISFESLFHVIPSRNQEQSFLSQYKGYPIFVMISGSKSYFFVPIDLKFDPFWMQSHLSPLWANRGVRDTLGYYYDPSMNYSWVFNKKKFILLNKAAIKSTLGSIPNGSKLIIDASNAKYIDFDVLELIKDFRNVQAEDKEIELTLKGFKEQYSIDNTEFKHVKIKDSKEEKK